MNKKLIRLTESDLHRIVKESVNRILKESDEWNTHLQQDDDNNDYNPIYDELIRMEMHNLYDLEGQVPQCYKREIHRCVTTLESILNEIKMKGNISSI